MGFFKSLKNAFFGNEIADELQESSKSNEEPFHVEEVELSPELTAELVRQIKAGKKATAVKVLRDSSQGTYSVNQAREVIDSLNAKIKSGFQFTVEETEIKTPPAISRAVVDLVLRGEMVKAIKQLRDESNGYYGLKEAKEVIDGLRYEAEHELLNPEIYGEDVKASEVNVSQEVIEKVVDGKKVEAIKLLIDNSGGMLTLKEAKTKVDEMEKYLKENYK